MTLRDYALRQLDRYLDRFSTQVKAVLADPAPDPIHDLRVATRRLSQALRIFEDALPPGVPREIRSQMSAIRQEAGGIRDGDVMSELFHKLNLQRTHRLFRTLAVNRLQQEQALRNSLSQLASAGCASVWRVALTAPVPHVHDSLAYARQHLSRASHKYFAAGRKLVAKPRTPAELHQFRILTKRFRYTLEMFAELYGPGLQVRLGKLRSVQETLGNLNDCVVASAMLGQFAPRHRLLARFAADTVAYESAFRYFWNSAVDAAGEERRWMRYFRYRGKSLDPPAPSTRQP